MSSLETTRPSDEMLQRWEREARAREERLEYGLTVADLRRLLKRALRVQIAVRIGSDSCDYDVSFPPTTAAAVRKMFGAYQPDEKVPCEFDPVERALVVGGFRSIRAAWPDRSFRHSP